MQRLRRAVKRLQERAIDAKAENASLFYATDVPVYRHDQAGHVDRALRDVLTLIDDLLEMVATTDDGTQGRLGFA